MSYYVYVLHSDSTDKYYVGCCADMEVRLKQHNTGRNTSTRSGLPWVIKKVEEYPTLILARKRETFIKKMKSRKFTEMVIRGER